MASDSFGKIDGFRTRRTASGRPAHRTLRASSSVSPSLSWPEVIVQFLQEFELAALLLIGRAGGRLQMQDGRIALSGTACLDSRRAGIRSSSSCEPPTGSLPILHDDESGKVSVCAAEAVSEPGAHGGPAGEDRAGIHLADRPT